MELFRHLPPHQRDSARLAVKGQLALRFPTGFSLKHSKQWIIVDPVDATGMVTKTHQSKAVVAEFVEYLSKHGIEHEIIQL